MTTTYPFTEAARAEAERWWPGIAGPTILALGAHMAEWARAHLAAQDSTRAACDLFHHIEDMADSLDDHVTQADVHRLLIEALGMARELRDHLAAQEPTDAEVLAALNADYALRYGGRNIPAESLEPFGDEHVQIMRAALAAAHRARQEKRRP